MQRSGKKIVSAVMALLIAANVVQLSAVCGSGNNGKLNVYAAADENRETIFEDSSEYLISDTLTTWKSKSYSYKYENPVLEGAVFSADIRVDDPEAIGNLKIQFHLNWKDALGIVTLTKDDFTNRVAEISVETEKAFTDPVTSIQVKAYSSDSGAASVYVSNFSLQNGVPSSNANLSALSYQIGSETSVPIVDFSAGTTEYNVVLPYGLADGTTVKLVGSPEDSTANAGDASCVISNGSGQAVMSVIAADGSIKKYTVKFTVSKDITLNSAQLVTGNTAAYGKTAEVLADTSVSGDYEFEYQWYKHSENSTVNGVKIQGATDKSYTPEISDIGGWIYCVVTAKNPVTGTAVTKPARVFADDEKLVTTVIRDTDGTIDSSTKALQLTNTIPYSGKFDADKLTPGGYFRVEYTGGSDVPKFNFNTWSSDYKPVDIAPTRTGGDAENGYWAEYSYEDCVAAWGDENFTYLKALRIKYTAADYEDVVINNVSWYGKTISYGELGTQIDCSVSSSATTGRLTWIYTRHVGGTFDTTRLREDGEFYVEYKGEKENALYLVASSYSDVNSTYVKVPASEHGKTATGYYSKFTVADIVKKFGSDFRYFDQIRIMAADPDTDEGIEVQAGSARLYLFEGTGDYVDYVEDVLTVPWSKYENTEKDGIAVIGASITQNPMVNAKVLDGEPYYKPLGDWNAVLDRTDCVTYGIGGQTTDQVATRFDEVLRWDFKKIIMQCGTNDLGLEPTDEAVVERIKGNYKIMLDKVKNSGKDIEVYIFSIMPSTPANYEGKANRIQMVDAAIEELCNEYDFAYYVDTYTPFLYTGEDIPEGCTHPGENHVNPDLVVDAIHPNAKGYAIIAEQLKPFINKTSDSDATLSGLSYTTESNPGRTTVDGFASGKTEVTEFNVKLPYGTDKNGVIKLYATGSDSGAIISSKDGDFIDGCLNVILKDGKASVTVDSKSKDGTNSESYTINFSISDYIFEDSSEHVIYANLADPNNWPYYQYNASYSGTVYAGAKIEYDVTVENAYNGKIFTAADFDWVDLDTLNIEYSEFDETTNTVHVTITTKKDYNGFGGLQIKFGNGGDCTYNGNIVLSNLTVTNGTNGEEPGEPNKPIDSQDPTDSDDPTVSSEPDDSDDTTDSDNTTDSDDTTDSGKSDDSGEPNSLSVVNSTQSGSNQNSPNKATDNPNTGATSAAMGSLAAIGAMLLTVLKKNRKDK